MEEVLTDEPQFNIAPEVEVGDLTEVKQEKMLIPPAQGLKVRIHEIQSVGKEADKWLGIAPVFEIVDGIETDGEIKYKGSFLRSLICIYANAEKYTGSFAEKINKRQHLFDLKRFLEALGEDIGNVKLNDAMYESLKGRILLVNVKQKTNKESGEIENVVGGYKQVSDLDTI